MSIPVGYRVINATDKERGAKGMKSPQTNHREKDKSYFTVSVAIVIHTVVVFILFIYKWFWYPNAFRGYTYNFLAHLLQEFVSFFSSS